MYVKVTRVNTNLHIQVNTKVILQILYAVAVGNANFVDGVT